MGASLHSSPELVSRGPRTGAGGPRLWLSLVGGLVVEKSSKTLLCVSLEGVPGPGPRWHSCVLMAPPWSLHPLPSLISAFPPFPDLHLPFGAQGRAWKLIA